MRVYKKRIEASAIYIYSNFQSNDIGDIIGILGKLKSTLGGIRGSGDIDSKIDSAFSRSSPFARSPQEGASKSSMSERVLAGHEKFNDQFSQRNSAAQSAPSGQFGRTEEFGRFGDPDAEFRSNPLEFNDDLDRMEAPKSPPPLQIRRNAPESQGIASSLQQQPANRWSPQSQANIEAVNRPVGFPDSNSNIPERQTESFSGQSRELTYTEKRLFDEIEDIKAQNNEILRRLQRIEAKIR